MKKMSNKNWPGLLAAGIGTAAAGIGLALHHKKQKEASEEAVIFGLICPMEEETTPFREAMDITETTRLSGLTFYKGTLDGQTVVLSQCGVGKVNAAVCAEILCEHFQISYLINIGVAGTTHEGIKQGDIVIGNDAVQHDMDVTCRGYRPGEVPDMFVSYFLADDDLIALAEQAAKNCELDGAAVHTGRIASGDQFICGGEQADKIKETFDPYAVEMEGAAVAQTAWVNQIPFVIIRAISDNADKDAPTSSYDDFLPLAVIHSFSLVRRMLLLAGGEEASEA